MRSLLMMFALVGLTSSALAGDDKDERESKQTTRPTRPAAPARPSSSTSSTTTDNGRGPSGHNTGTSTQRPTQPTRPVAPPPARPSPPTPPARTTVDYGSPYVPEPRPYTPPRPATPTAPSTDAGHGPSGHNVPTTRPPPPPTRPVSPRPPTSVTPPTTDRYIPPAERYTPPTRPVSPRPPTSVSPTPPAERYTPPTRPVSPRPPTSVTPPASDRYTPPTRPVSPTRPSTTVNPRPGSADDEWYTRPVSPTRPGADRGTPDAGTPDRGVVRPPSHAEPAPHTPDRSEGVVRPPPRPPGTSAGHGHVHDWDCYDQDWQHYDRYDAPYARGYQRPSYASAPPPRASSSTTRRDTVDRDNRLSVGLLGTTLSSGYRASEGGVVGGYTDPGMGLGIRLRNGAFAGELGLIHFDASFDAASPRRQPLLQLSAMGFLAPESRVQPYGLVGYTWNGRQIDDTYLDGGVVQHVETGESVRGPHVGVGVELGIGERVAIDLDGRLLGYVNKPADDPSLAGALQATVSVLYYF